jgi:hypothetical protein
MSTAVRGLVSQAVSATPFLVGAAWRVIRKWTSSGNFRTIKVYGPVVVAALVLVQGGRRVGLVNQLAALNPLKGVLMDLMRRYDFYRIPGTAKYRWVSSYTAPLSIYGGRSVNEGKVVQPPRDDNDPNPTLPDKVRKLGKGRKNRHVSGYGIGRAARHAKNILGCPALTTANRLAARDIIRRWMESQSWHEDQISCSLDRAVALVFINRESELESEAVLESLTSQHATRTSLDRTGP